MKNINICALYIRLSREDGDKKESLSIINQRLLLQEFTKKLTNLYTFEYYIDDGYTGTNFERPGFQKLIQDIETGTVNCVIVKDLSRLGRNMAKVSTYVQEYFPSKKVRFIAVDDGIDRQFFDIDTSEDMMIDMKNMFNGFYPKDISKKVRSTFRSKQKAGQFIGAFASYGYKKSPADHNSLIIDKPAADIVQRIFNMYITGYGQNTIAKKLNEEKIPCPSEYKKQCGLNYQNCNRLKNTTYWTYSSVRNILRNRIYTGAMVQNRSFRQICKSKSIPLPENEWIIVPNTHKAIIDEITFDKVQKLLKQNTRHVNLDQNIHPFAGLLKCGDCGRAMVKIKRHEKITFHCGSYNRYGTEYCSSHSIDESDLTEIVISDINVILSSITNLKEIIIQERDKATIISNSQLAAAAKLQKEMQKLIRKKERIYNDYLEELITKQEYIKYKETFESQSETLEQQINVLKKQDSNNILPQCTWLDNLLETGHLEQLDRATVAEMIHMIYIYDTNTIKIIYNL